MFKFDALGFQSNQIFDKFENKNFLLLKDKLFLRSILREPHIVLKKLNLGHRARSIHFRDTRSSITVFAPTFR